MIKKWVENIGPGPLIAAAFIGPGTVATCSKAGVAFSFDLLWVMVIAIIGAIVLQNMAVRLGITTQKGLSEVLRQELKNPILKILAVLLILAAIVIGNAAYEAGNISGGILGIETVFGASKITLGSLNVNVYSLFVGAIAFVLLYIGNYKILERFMITLVILMSIAFLVTAIMTKPNLSQLFKGLFIPKIPDTGLFDIIALIGTTIVPYNIFLHASLVKEKWKSTADLPKAKRDTVLAIVMGGFVSMAIIVSGAAVSLNEVKNGADLAVGLEPLFGDFAKYFLSIGLFAAGITSAITAPLAAAYVVKGCLGWEVGLRSKKMRAVWMFILILGIVFSSIGLSAIEVINFAQVTNGILLPIVAAFLLWIMNKKELLGDQRNSLLQNLVGFAILAITIFIGLRGILKGLSLL